MLLATVPTAEGGPAALLEVPGQGTLLSRLAGQLAAIGIADVRVICRPGHEHEMADAMHSGRVGVRVLVSPDTAGDLRAIADIANEAGGGLGVLAAESIVHQQVLTGLLTDPRTPTAILTTATGRPRHLAFRTRARRGRVISAGSPYHRVHRPTRWSLSMLRVAAPDRPALAAAAIRLAAAVDEMPEPWQAELERKAEQWRRALGWAAQRPEPSADEEAREAAVIPIEQAEDEVAADEGDQEDEGQPPELGPDDEARLAELVAAAREDSVGMLTVGLIRSGAYVRESHLRGFHWARPLSPGAIERSMERLAATDEDDLLLRSAVKGNDGFFTTFLVSPYSRHIARWAARRGLNPNQITTFSLLLGIAAAACFATGERPGLVAGAILLQAAFTMDCVDGQLARYTRTFTRFGGWLDAIFDRAKEYIAFAGLAIGAAQTGDPAWTLACCALTLQTLRHISGFAFTATQQQALEDREQPALEEVRDRATAEWYRRREARAAAMAAGAAPATPVPAPLPRRILRRWHEIDHRPAVVWGKKMIAFPIGERFAVISLTAALFSPRVTFIAMLALGAVALVYTQAGRVLRSIARRRATGTDAGSAELVRMRDDGPLARAFTRALASRGVAPPEPLRWMVPPAIRVIEYGGIAAIGAVAGAGGAPYALLAVLTYRHYDLEYRQRQRGDLSLPWLDALTAGWEGRLIIAAVLALLGLLPGVMYAWAAVLGVALVAESITAWRGYHSAEQTIQVQPEDAVE